MCPSRFLFVWAPLLNFHIEVYCIYNALILDLQFDKFDKCVCTQITIITIKIVFYHPKMFPHISLQYIQSQPWKITNLGFCLLLFLFFVDIDKIWIFSWKKKNTPWPLWLSWLGIVPWSERSSGWFPVRACAWIVGLAPCQGIQERQPSNVSLPLLFSPFSCLNK